MKEYLLVEFIAEGDDIEVLEEKLALLGEDFKKEKEHNYTNYANAVSVIFGRISSIYASVIKLKDPFLAERMRISYIPDELKDKYRK